MPASRHVLCVALCAIYLPAAALPCPTAGLDRTRPPESRAAATPVATASAPRADAAGLKAPCTCGCGKRAASAAGSARLAPVLASASPPALPSLRPAPPLVPEPALPGEPFRALDPVPI